MKRIRVIIDQKDGQEVLKITDPLFVAVVADRFIIEDQRRPISKATKQVRDRCSAVVRRLSPDRKKRWMPTINGKIVAGGRLPFGGFATRREAIAAAKDFEANA
jgi:hypothetical protein